MRRTFVMITGAGMMGKSTAAEGVRKANPEIALLTCDELMLNMFAIARQAAMPINDMQRWRDTVNQSVDCDKLIRLLHRDFIARNYAASVVLADGYVYMKEWYRQQVISGLGQLGAEFDYWLLKYAPPIEEQIRRRALKYSAWGWAETTREVHERELLKAWSDFETPRTKDISLREVNDSTLADVIREILTAA